MKRILALVLITFLMMNSSLLAIADTRENNIKDSIYIDLEKASGLTMDIINSSSEKDIDLYFESIFSTKASMWRSEEKYDALERVIALNNSFKSPEYQVFSRYSQEFESASVTSRSAINGCTYTGSKGVSWVRDTTSNGTPLSWGELISGVYTLEVDFLPYNVVATLYALSTDKSFFEMVKNAGTTATASALICKKAGIKGVIGGGVIGFCVSLGWDLLSLLDRNALRDMMESMVLSDLMRVDFVTASNMVTKCYSKYTTSVEWIDSKQCFKYLNIANPTGKAGNWHGGEPGYLYSY
ncbi:hypothetical protein [Fusibacter ferrireducens]|uniref:Uncharacterized protein n=1 Tax=Fusibacter ferrireducens TaxID=2785058 RepID=A0ABR9ZNI8_9FIRM|nr:hypothetical protein [Fusibacter ferrireducens]MBF4692006.1 hypothetical protein [Fusibacter ferrireducens]